MQGLRQGEPGSAGWSEPVAPRDRPPNWFCGAIEWSGSERLNRKLLSINSKSSSFNSNTPPTPCPLFLLDQNFTMWEYNASCEIGKTRDFDFSPNIRYRTAAPLVATPHTHTSGTRILWCQRRLNLLLEPLSQTRTPLYYILCNGHTALQCY
jgi:hypothetical protein